MGVDWKSLGKYKGVHTTATLSKEGGEMKLFLAVSSAHCRKLDAFSVSFS